LTVIGLIDAINSNGWVGTFTEESKKKILKIKGLGRLQEPAEGAGPRNEDVHLHSVTCLDIGRQSIDDLMLIIHMLPNLQELEMNNIRAWSGTPVLGMIASLRPNLTRVKWNGLNTALLCPPDFTSEHASNLTELQINYVHLNYRPRAEETEAESMFSMDLLDHDTYLWNHCTRLERLSMRGVMYNTHGKQGRFITQAHLIRLVRRHPTLRWLRSDLSLQNIAMLNRERPEGTLC